MCVCMHVCMCVCVYVCLYAYMYVYVSTCATHIFCCRCRVLSCVCAPAHIYGRLCHCVHTIPMSYLYHAIYLSTLHIMHRLSQTSILANVFVWHTTRNKFYVILSHLISTHLILSCNELTHRSPVVLKYGSGISAADTNVLLWDIDYKTPLSQ